MSSQDLRTAYQLIKSGQKVQAEAQLRDLLDEDPDNADAWWLFANATSDPADTRRALERNLALRPDHTAGQKALAAFNRKYPPVTAEPDFDDLLDAEYVEQPEMPRKVTVTKPTGGNNQAWLLFGAIGLIALLICGGIVAVALEVTRVVEEVVSSEEMAMMQQAIAEASAYAEVPDNAEVEGNISVGERKEAMVDTFIDDVWTFAGRAGQQVNIRLNARDGILDPQLFLFHPDGYPIATNDDRNPGSDLNSEINATLPSEGRYTIVVSAFGQGGAYELLLH